MKSHGALGRRSFLALTAAVALTTGCGVRIDSDPDLPTLSPTDTVRNRVAAILDATEATGLQASMRDRLAQAVGPVWAPPTELATDSPSPEPRRSFKDALTEVHSTITRDFLDLAGPTSGTLADVATGAALVLIREFDGNQKKLAKSFNPVVTPAPAPSKNASKKAKQDSETQRLAGFITACDKASYAYQRIAVFIEADTPYGAFTRERHELLAQAAEQARTFATSAKVDSIPSNQVAWQLPSDPRKGKKLAADVEEMVVATLPDVFAFTYPNNPQLEREVHALALRHLFESAHASSKAGRFELLRF